MISFTVKEVYTTNVVVYNIHININYNDLSDFLKTSICRDFHFSDDTFMLIDVEYSTLFRNYIGPAEEAPSVTYEYIYNKIRTPHIQRLHFYVRSPINTTHLIPRIMDREQHGI